MNDVICPVLVHNDEGDWMGVYDSTSRVLLYQGHDIEPARLLHIIGVTHTDMYGVRMLDSRLPRTLDELIRDQRIPDEDGAP